MEYLQTEALLALPAGMGTLLLGEPKPWVHEPWEMHERRMIGRKFAEYMEGKYGGLIVAPKGGFQIDDLEAAFRAGYDTPESW